jgi:membrane protein implicated in regulation of membrane protease activity
MLALAQVLRTTPSPAARWVVPAGVLVGLLGSTAGVALLWAGATPATINGLLRPTAMAMTLVVIALGLSFVRGRRPRRHTVETPTGRATPSTPG